MKLQIFELVASSFVQNKILKISEEAVGRRGSLLYYFHVFQKISELQSSRVENLVNLIV
jgi:hypothetical protein